MRAFLPPRCPLSEQLCVTIYISSTPSTYSNLIRRASIVSGGTSRLLEYTYTLVVQQSVQQRRIESTSSRVLCYIRIYIYARGTDEEKDRRYSGRQREREKLYRDGNVHFPSMVANSRPYRGDIHTKFPPSTPCPTCFVTVEEVPCIRTE